MPRRQPPRHLMAEYGGKGGAGDTGNRGIVKRARLLDARSESGQNLVSQAQHSRAGGIGAQEEHRLVEPNQRGEAVHRRLRQPLQQLPGALGRGRPKLSLEAIEAIQQVARHLTMIVVSGSRRRQYFLR
jgi:hypothetical protein